MKLKTLLIISLFVTLLSYNKKKEKRTIKADLTFKSISFENAFGANDIEYKDLLKSMDSVLKNDAPTNQNYILSKRFEKLKEYNLLRSPYIHLKTKEDSILTVFLSEKEYSKVSYLKYLDLFKENKKVIIELEILEKDTNIIYSNNIISIIKVDSKSNSNL